MKEIEKHAMTSEILPGRSARVVAPSTQRTRWGAWSWPLAVGGVLLGAFVARLPYLDVPISADVGGYATAAYWWARGDTLYDTITITRPQGVFVVFRAIEALGLGSTRGIHLFATLWALLATLALLAVGTRVWGRAIGLATVGLYAAAMATPWVQGYDANAELLMTLPLLLGLLALLHADERPLGDRRDLLLLTTSGLLGAGALLLKPAGVAALPLAAFWLLRRRATEGASWRNWLAATGALALGWAAGLAPALIHGLNTAPERYLGAVLLYRLGQDSLIGGAVGHQLDYFATNSLYLLGHLPLLLFAPLGLRLAAHRDDRRRRALLALWLLTALGGTALGGNWFLHYYQQVLPPLALAVALALRWLLRRPLGPPRFAAACLAALACLPLVLPITGGLAGGVDLKTLPEWEPNVAAVAPIAAYVQARSGPDDTLYVAYDHADIYYLARRRPAARWLHFRELGRTPGAFAEQVARLDDPATAPLYIVGAQTFDRWGFDPERALRAVVTRDYGLETTIGGIELYRHKGR